MAAVTLALRDMTAAVNTPLERRADADATPFALVLAELGVSQEQFDAAVVPANCFCPRDSL